MSKKNPKFYRVKSEGISSYPSLRYGGMVGRLKYDNASFSVMQSGFEAVLVFSDGFSDGFSFSELEPVDQPN